MVRDRSVLFFSYLLPLSFFFLFAQSFHGAESTGAMTQVITMVLIIGVLGNGFFGAGMRAVQDREADILRRFKVAPTGALPIIVASIVSGVAAFAPSVFLFFFFGTVIYRAPLPANLLSVLVFLTIGVIAFRALGMIVAGVVNSVQEMSILVQILNTTEVAGQMGIRPDGKTTYKVNNGHPNPELLISAPFVVIEDASGGASFTIEPITLELKGNLKNKAIHKIDLTFKR